MKKNIDITIAAGAGTGKSSLTYLFKEFLKEKGIEYTVEDTDLSTEEEIDKHFSTKDLTEVTNSLKEKVVVNFKQVQLSKGVRDDQDRVKEFLNV